MSNPQQPQVIFLYLKKLWTFVQVFSYTYHTNELIIHMIWHVMWHNPINYLWLNKCLGKVFSWWWSTTKLQGVQPFLYCKISSRSKNVPKIWNPLASPANVGSPLPKTLATPLHLFSRTWQHQHSAVTIPCFAHVRGFLPAGGEVLTSTDLDLLSMLISIADKKAIN